MDNLAAEFTISNENYFDCLFEIYTNDVFWGDIYGDITNQTDLINILNTKQDSLIAGDNIQITDNRISATDTTYTAGTGISIENGIISNTQTSAEWGNITGTLSDQTDLKDELDTLSGQIAGNHSEITDINLTLQGYGDIVTYNATDFATSSQGALADTALQPNDNITLLNNNAGYITSADIPTLADLTTTAQLAAINSGATSTKIGQIATNTQNITDEVTNRQNADNGLQSQIDAIVSSSDVFDIVGTYAELQAYDISTVPVNDIIKVLVDSTHSNAATYYRCVESGSVKTWSYIGSEGAYYTKSEADGRFVAQTITVNGQPLSSNVTLTASDVGALPDSTVIPTVNNSTITIQKNSTTVDTFTLNQSSAKTINISVPTDTSDLTNGAGYITGITSGDVTTALGYTPYNSSNPNGYISGITSTDVTTALGYTPYNSTNPSGYITSSALTNYVTTNTAQNISGRKTFLGEKAIYFKQSATTDKLGFTLYNPSNAEVGGLEYRPNTIGSNSLLALNCPQATGGYVGFRYWGSPAVNIVAPKVATAGNYYIPVNLTDGTNTVTANNNGTVNISTLLPDVSNFVTNSSLATALAHYVTNANLATTLSDYVLISSLSTVATSGSYNDLSNKPTIPSEVTESTVSGWGFTKNTGTVTSVNNITPVNGNVNLTIPDTSNLANKDLSNLSSTGNSKFQSPLVSGTNIKTINNTSLLGSGNIPVLQNTATGSNALTLLGTACSVPNGINIGYGSSADRECVSIGTNATTNNLGVAIGYNTEANYSHSTALGMASKSTANGAIQIGYGTNATANSLNIGFYHNTAIHYNYQLLDGTTGLIPDARISNNIARTSAIPTQASDISAADTTLSNVSSISNNSAVKTALNGKADTTLSNVSSIDSNSAVQTALDGKVSKSGDTMTGDLTILSDNGFFAVKSSFDSTTITAPSEFISLGTLAIYDTNDNYTGFIQNSFNANNTVRITIGARRIINGVNKTASLGLSVDPSGNATCTFPDTTCVDGQWVKNVASLSTSSAVGTYNLTNTLKAKLPNDSYNYEILLVVNGRSTGSSQCFLQTAYTSKEYVLWLTANSRSAGTFIVLPVNAARTLTQEVAGAAFGAIEIKLQAYRRIGTNS